MAKKYLEVKAQGRRRVLEASDIKSIYFFQKKRTPALPRYLDEDSGDDMQCGSPTVTDISIQDECERLNSMFLP